MTGNLFDSLVDDRPQSTWVPPEPPSLSGVTDIELDCETTGLRWWAGDRPVGIGLALPDGSTRYLPWGHRGGGNLDEAAVKRWAQQELRGKRITNLNTRFDVHMLREWGVDLEAQGCTVSDVGHYAALLDDHRFKFSLEAIVNDYLPGEEEKVKVVGGMALDPTRMAEYHAGIVAVRAEGDVRQVQKLKRLMWPLLDAEGLQEVRQLEDDVIFVVCEMEKNGALIDLELLDTWIKETEAQRVKCLMDIHAMTGVRVQPRSRSSLATLFSRLGIEIEARTLLGATSYSTAVLAKIEHPVIPLLLRVTRLETLRSKYLLKYREVADSHGLLRYSLHQLRAQKDDSADPGDAGTVSGRFSSTAPSGGMGVNIQQVMKPEKQVALYGPDFIVRQLHIPASGLFLSADAMQIEYRIFAEHANTPSVIAGYKDNPLMSFHKFVWELVKEHKPDIRYRQQKDLNFAKIYGAGLIKMAAMLGFISLDQAEHLRKTRAFNDPSLIETKRINQIYNRVLPEVGPLLKRASNLAATRGYVHTLLGRRMRFPDKQRLHKALNGVIQGTAADIMKKKLVELHRERKYTGFLLRYTVHDEVDGDAPDKTSVQRVREILNRQTSGLQRVPILWEVESGPNWNECHD